MMLTNDTETQSLIQQQLKASCDRLRKRQFISAGIVAAAVTLFCFYYVAKIFMNRAKHCEEVTVVETTIETTKNIDGELD